MPTDAVALVRAGFLLGLGWCLAAAAFDIVKAAVQWLRSRP